MPAQQTGQDYREATLAAGKEARAAAERVREVTSAKAKAQHDELAHLHEKAGNKDTKSDHVRNTTLNSGLEARAAAEAERAAITKKAKAQHDELNWVHQKLADLEKRLASLEHK